MNILKFTSLQFFPSKKQVFLSQLMKEKKIYFASDIEHYIERKKTELCAIIYNILCPKAVKE